MKVTNCEVSRHDGKGTGKQSVAIDRIGEGRWRLDPTESADAGGIRFAHPRECVASVRLR